MSSSDAGRRPVDLLERCAVPRLEVERARRLVPAVELDVGVADEDVGRLQRRHRLGGADRHGRDVGREAPHEPLVLQPEVLRLHPAREQTLVEGTGAVGVAPVERVVKDPHR
jgi:hypothetical protein